MRFTCPHAYPPCRSPGRLHAPGSAPAWRSAPVCASGSCADSLCLRHLSGEGDSI
ncbi:hypothetical protein ASZ90_008832 [hydrocarbon metagenome]|uniref:Uncharacterized protein n=1 Tax=hydrocarbon metagenome TaxID=938273 RepID=A0A0W8FKG1_9ZZZZ